MQRRQHPFEMPVVALIRCWRTSPAAPMRPLGEVLGGGRWVHGGCTFAGWATPWEMMWGVRKLLSLLLLVPERCCNPAGTQCG